jgi:hypothetical protein
VGFANEAFGEYLTSSLSTINQQTAHIREEAARLFNGSTLFNVAAVISTMKDSTAILYDAGFVVNKIPGKTFHSQKLQIK